MGRRAIFAATLARGVEIWPRLLAFARRDDLPTETRRGAVFWLGQAAGEKATEGLVSVIEDEGDLEVREHAVFALSRREEEEAVSALLQIARTNPEPRLRKLALFWLGQRAGDDPRVLDLFESILVGGR
ncbi:MAG: HEAT repeat domain-containing protein [Gemmatimonadota bacterium]